MKLVRDRIGDLPWPDEQAKQHLGWVAPDSPEYRELLRLKLFEEAGELADADRRGDADAVLEEAADVYEVLRALLVIHGFTQPSGARLALDHEVNHKFMERGGFFQGRTWSGPERAGHPAKAPVNPCCDDSGFADYAAVPCPNPKCTAVVGDDERQARSIYGLGVPEGGFRRAREAAERLPTVGQWSAETAPTTPPTSTEAGEDGAAVGEDAPEPQNRSERADDPYRWQWSTDGTGPWTFAASETHARHAASPNGWVQRVSRLDGSAGKPMPAVRIGRPGVERDADGIPLKLKSNHQCRLCGRWFEGEWANATDQAERDRIQAEMDHGRCEPGRCRKPGEYA